MAGGGSRLERKARPHADYLIRWPHRPETVEADSARVEGIHTTLRGIVLVTGRPREVVLRRVPREVLVEELPAGGGIDVV